MDITWLGQGGYLIQQAGQRLVIDPYLSDALAGSQGLRRLAPPPLEIGDLAATSLFITHDHLDHFDPETLVPLLREAPGCPLLGPQSVIDRGQRLGLEASRLGVIRVGEAVHLPGLSLTPTPALHSDACAVGVLIEGGGRLIYVSGDTLYAPTLAAQVQSLCNRPLDAALVCINGRLGNMDLTQAADLVAALRPGIAVPMHYGLFAENSADPQAFVAACGARGQKTVLLEIGGTFRL